MVPVAFIVHDAGVFRRAYPRWPHAEAPMTTTPAPQGGTPMTTPKPRTYPVELTAGQIFGFSDLVRRLTLASVERPLRHDLAAALMAFEALLPEPSGEDGDAYVAAVQAGLLPAWGMDLLPLTGTHAELEEATLAARAQAAEDGEDDGLTDSAGHRTFLSCGCSMPFYAATEPGTPALCADHGNVTVAGHGDPAEADDAPDEDDDPGCAECGHARSMHEDAFGRALNPAECTGYVAPGDGTAQDERTWDMRTRPDEAASPCARPEKHGLERGTRHVFCDQPGHRYPAPHGGGRFQTAAQRALDEQADPKHDPHAEWLAGNDSAADAQVRADERGTR